MFKRNMYMLAVLAAFPCFCALAHAQDAMTPAEIESQLREMSRKALAFELPQGIDATIERVFPGKVTEAQVQELKRQVAGKPDHPLRSKLETDKRVLALGGVQKDSARIVFWSEKLWRVNTDTPYIDVSALDYAHNETTHWTMSTQGLNLEPSASDGNQKAKERFGYSTPLLTNLLFQGMSNVSFTRNLGPVDVKVTDSAFVATLTYDQGLKMIVDGSISTERAIVVTRVRSDGLPTFRLDTKFFDHKVDANFGFVATRFTQLLNDTFVECRLTSIDKVDRPFVVSVAETPSATGSDPIRGKLRLNTLQDSRGPREIVSKKLGEEWRQSEGSQLRRVSGPSCAT